MAEGGDSDTRSVADEVRVSQSMHMMSSVMKGSRRIEGEDEKRSQVVPIKNVISLIEDDQGTSCQPITVRIKMSTIPNLLLQVHSPLKKYSNMLTISYLLARTQQ